MIGILLLASEHMEVGSEPYRKRRLLLLPLCILFNDAHKLHRPAENKIMISLCDKTMNSAKKNILGTLYGAYPSAQYIQLEIEFNTVGNVVDMLTRTISKYLLFSSNVNSQTVFSRYRMRIEDNL